MVTASQTCRQRECRCKRLPHTTSGGRAAGGVVGAVMGSPVGHQTKLSNPVRQQKAHAGAHTEQRRAGCPAEAWRGGARRAPCRQGRLRPHPGTTPHPLPARRRDGERRHGRQHQHSTARRTASTMLGRPATTLAAHKAPCCSGQAGGRATGRRAAARRLGVLLPHYEPSQPPAAAAAAPSALIPSLSHTSPNNAGGRASRRAGGLRPPLGWRRLPCPPPRPPG
jgi:hypothetical protein